MDVLEEQGHPVKFPTATYTRIKWIYFKTRILENVISELKKNKEHQTKYVSITCGCEHDIGNNIFQKT